MNKVIILVRHGEAESVSGSVADFDRALTTKGRNDIIKLAHTLNAMQLIPSQIVASPLVRAQQTAEILATELKIRSVIPDDSFVSESSTDEIFSAILRQEKDVQNLLCVGHEPSISATAGVCLRGGVRALPTVYPGTALVIEFQNEIQKGSGNLLRAIRA